MSSSNDRRVHIDRIGVEKNRFLSKGEINGASPKICSGPENQNSSISLGKYNANAKEFWTVFEPDITSGGNIDFRAGGPEKTDVMFDVIHHLMNQKKTSVPTY